MRIKGAVAGALVSAFLLAAFGTGAQDAEEAARRQFQNGVELAEGGVVVKVDAGGFAVTGRF